MATKPSSTTTRQTRICEVHEFIRCAPNGGLLAVVHYRTVYHEDGRIRKEAIPAIALLPRIIRAFHGSPRESEGTLTGFFDDPKDATECAATIARHYGMTAEISGTQITFAI